MLIEYHRTTLSPEGQTAYANLYTAIMQENSACTFSGLSSQDVLSVVKAVSMDHPELIRYPALAGAMESRGGSVTLPLTYLNVDREAYDRRLNALVDRISRSLTPNATEYSRCRAIFDALAIKLRYERRLLNEYGSIMSSNSSSEVMQRFIAENGHFFSPYGILMYYRGVCHGIAKLFKILCDLFGVPCACAEAVSTDGTNTPHLLNVVEIDGQRSFVDLTNGLMSDDFPVIRYEFFLMPARIYSRSFDVTGEFECTAEHLHYYARNGLRFTDLGAMRRYLCAYTTTTSDGAARCFYDGEPMSDEKLKDFFDEILSRHNRVGFRVATIVQNGFCTGLTNVS